MKHENSTIAYHLRELEIARDPNSSKHILPETHSNEVRLLDIGCGIGQSLVALEHNGESLLVGVDIDTEALRYGAQNFEGIRYLSAGAEYLPFTDGQFDLVISRVSLPYTDIPTAFAEIHRVLRPGGRIWATFHSANFAYSELWNALRGRNYKDVIFRLYVILNGTFGHLFGSLVSFPNGKCESFQTHSRIKRWLTKTGFQTVSFAPSDHFIVEATKKK